MKHETTIIEQILAGMELPHDAAPRCSDCRTAVEGADIIVCARRVYGADGWEINAVWCPEHAPETAPKTPHGVSVLASARVGMLADMVEQTHRHALIDPVVEDKRLGNGAPPELGSDGNAHTITGP